MEIGLRYGLLRTTDGPRLVAVIDGAPAVLNRDGHDVRAVLGDIEPWDGSAAPDADAPWDAPLRPGKVVAIGLNYLDHASESGVGAPSAPLVFAKFPSCLTGPEDPIVIDDELTERVDWEVELAVVVGRRMDRVDRASALDHVFGYTVANDVSARDVQFGDGQWTRGKSFATFCPVGPAIVTPDELTDVDDLALATRVNGELVQDDRTSSMVFGVAEILSYCSHSFVLEPGDLVLTGTPPGCGEFMDPPRSLKPGDVVEVTVEGVGSLRNPVVAFSRPDIGVPITAPGDLA